MFYFCANKSLNLHILVLLSDWFCTILCFFLQDKFTHKFYVIIFQRCSLGWINGWILTTNASDDTMKSRIETFPLTSPYTLIKHIFDCVEAESCRPQSVPVDCGFLHRHRGIFHPPVPGETISKILTSSSTR